MPSTLPLITIRRSREQRSDNGVNIQIVITNIAGLPHELDLSELRANVSLISDIYVSEPQTTNGELSFSIDMAAARFGRHTAGQIVASIVKMMPDVIVMVLDLANRNLYYYVAAIRINGGIQAFSSRSIIVLLGLIEHINNIMPQAEVDAIFTKLVSDAPREWHIILAMLDLNRDE